MLPRSTSGDSAALGEELADVRVVLEEVVELDDVVGGERRCVRTRSSGRRRLDVEQLRVQLRRLVVAIDIDTGGHEQGHDLAVRPLFPRVVTLGACEAVAALAPVGTHRQQDRLGTHVHFAAPRAGCPDGGHTPETSAMTRSGLRGVRGGSAYPELGTSGTLP